MSDKEDLTGLGVRPPRQRYEMRRIEAAREAKALRSGKPQPPLSPAEVLTARGEGRLIYYLSEGADRLDRALMELSGAEGGVVDQVMAAFKKVREIIDELESPPKPEPATSHPPLVKKQRRSPRPKRKTRKTPESPKALIRPDGTEIEVNSWVETRMALVKQIQERKPGEQDMWAGLPHVRKRADMTSAQARSGSRNIGGNLHVLVTMSAQKHRSTMREELKTFGLQAEKWGLRMPSGIENI